MANVIKHKRGSGSDPSASDLVVGEVAIRTDVGKLFTKMDNGSVAEIAGGGSDIAINTLSSSSGTGGGSATFNGSAYRFTLSAPPSVSAQQLLVSINGVIQKPVAGTGQPSEGFSVDGNDIILGDAPATGADFFILTFKSLGVSEPADNSVTSAKIVDGAIVNADINASAAIARTKLANVDLVDDTSPQLGGDLATNGNDILIADNDKLKIGTGNDLVAYHDGTSNIITNVNGNLFIQSAAATDGLKILNNGAVELFHAGSKRFETSSNGVRISGGSSGGGVAELIELNGAGNDLNDGVKLNFARAGSDCGSIVLQKVNNNNTTDFILNTRASNTTSETVRITGGGFIKLNGTDNTIHTNSDAAKIAIFGGSTNSVSHGGVVSMTGVNHSAGCFTDLAAGTGGHIQFRIGTSHAMRIDSGGSVGIGETTPSGKLHISSGTSGDCELHIEADTDNNDENDNPRIVFRQDGGQEQAMVGKGNNQLILANGVPLTDGGIIFKTGTTVGYTNTTTRMYIDGNGKIMMNTTSFPQTNSSRLTVAATWPEAPIDCDLTSGNSSATQINFFFNGTGVGRIESTSSATSLISGSSDRTLKKNFEDWTETVLTKFKTLNPQKFNFIHEQDTDNKTKGYIAQDLVNDFPEAYPKDPITEKYSFSPMNMVVYLMKALQEAVARIEALEAK